ncbi:MAG: hypothetical protein QM704_06820 [Anaeromyxobacteraceae bacterium]
MVESSASPEVGSETPPVGGFVALDALAVRVARDRGALDLAIGQKLGELMDVSGELELGYSQITDFAREKLGLKAAFVRRLVRFEQKCQELPQLREAMRSGKLSYEQARLVSKLATAEDVAAKIEEAAGKTCITLQRETMAELHSQMWNRDYLDVFVTEEIDGLLAEAVQAARKAAGQWIPLPDAIEAIARHCLKVWTPIVHEKLKNAHPIMVRDGGECTVAGCSRVGVPRLRPAAAGLRSGWSEMDSLGPYAPSVAAA